MLTRRHIFPLAGVAVLGTTVGKAETPTVSDYHGALKISLRHYGCWEVQVPMKDTPWRPGFPVAVEWISLERFLAEVEKECGIASLAASGLAVSKEGAER